MSQAENIVSSWWIVANVWNAYRHSMTREQLDRLDNVIRYIALQLEVA